MGLRQFLIQCVCLLCLCLPSWSSALPVNIQSIQYQADGNFIQLLSSQPFSKEFSTTVLPNPNRAIIDIPNVTLSSPMRTLEINQHGIDRIELSQSNGSTYQLVRIIVFGSSLEALNTLKLIPRGTAFQIGWKQSSKITTAINPNNLPLPNIPGQTSPPAQYEALHSMPVSQLVSVERSKLSPIESVSYSHGALVLKTQAGKKLQVLGKMVLKNPSRVAIDLSEAYLVNPELAKNPIYPADSAVTTVRLAQFNPTTVRIVFETSRPDMLQLTYLGVDKSKLNITTSETRPETINTLPKANQTVGSITDLRLNRRTDTTLIQLYTSSAMVRRVTRLSNQIRIDLLNIASKPGPVLFDKAQFPGLQEIRLEPLSQAGQNTRLVVVLSQPTLEMSTHLSLDEQVLELTLNPKSALPLEQVNGVKRGKYTVVVDAGHGGKDVGANRAGIFEKNLNLTVALKLKRSLEALGATVYMTREADVFLELSQITSITNSIQPDAFISVHTNASVNPNSNGLETYFYTPQSRALANRVHKRAINMVASPDRGVRSAKFYVIHHTQVPAILFEMGYVSNAPEREALQNAARQQATADALAQGVIEFLADLQK
jgi:N-acetylmuramoyl-L-alanine amidase